MDVEQAMKWASLRTSSQGCDDQDYAAFTTLAAEVRRLSGAVPAGCVRDDKGEDFPVLGELPLTADRCVAGRGEYDLHHPAGSTWRPVVICAYYPFGHEYDPSIGFDEVYSTRAAAEAARERGNG